MLHPLIPSQQDWALQMRYVQARDAGTYECQVGEEEEEVGTI